MEASALPQLQQLAEEKQQVKAVLEGYKKQADALSRIEELCGTVATAGAGTDVHTFFGKAVKHKLRMTGLQEDEEESQDNLLHKVQIVLDSLPRKVPAVSAQHQGRPGGKRARAVVITFANAQGAV